jgi:hypothetical protein
MRLYYQHHIMVSIMVSMLCQLQQMPGDIKAVLPPSPLSLAPAGTLQATSGSQAQTPQPTATVATSECLTPVMLPPCPCLASLSSTATLTAACGWGTRSSERECRDACLSSCHPIPPAH